jgi:hypothetical protein
VLGFDSAHTRETEVTSFRAGTLPALDAAGEAQVRGRTPTQQWICLRAALSSAEADWAKGHVRRGRIALPGKVAILA